MLLIIILRKLVPYVITLGVFAGIPYGIFYLEGMEREKVHKLELENGPWEPMVCTKLSIEHGHKSELGYRLEHVLFTAYTINFSGPKHESSSQFIESLGSSESEQAYFKSTCRPFLREIMKQNAEEEWLSEELLKGVMVAISITDEYGE